MRASGWFAGRRATSPAYRGPRRRLAASPAGCEHPGHPAVVAVLAESAGADSVSVEITVVVSVVVIVEPSWMLVTVAVVPPESSPDSATSQPSTPPTASASATAATTTPVVTPLRGGGGGLPPGRAAAGAGSFGGRGSGAVTTFRSGAGCAPRRPRGAAA